MVVTRRDVGHQRAERVERRFAAGFQLLVHILLDLVHGNMARPFDHHLHILRPGALGQLAQRVELGELRFVIGIGDAAGAQAVAQRIGDVIGLHDLGDLVEAFVEETFLVMREAPFRHDAAAAADNAGDALRGHRHIGQAHAGMDGEIVDALLRLLDQRVAENLPGEILGNAANLFQRLIDRHGADGDGAVADDPFARVVDIAAGGQIHDGVRTPADRPDHLVDFARHIAGDGGIADIGIDLDEEIAANRHRLAFGVIDVGRDDRPPARHFVADEFGRDVIGDFGAPGFAAIAVRRFQRCAAEIFALGDIFHLGGDDAALRVMHLTDIAATSGAENFLRDIREAGDAARAVRPQLAVIFGADFARGIFLDIAALQLPFAAQGREAGADVDRGGRIGIGAGRVIHPHRRLARGRLQIDLAHGDLAVSHIDLAAAPDRPGGDADFELRVDVGHMLSPHSGERSFDTLGMSRSKPFPPPVLTGSGSTGRALLHAPLSESSLPGDSYGPTR